MSERDIAMAHMTILRWNRESSPAYQLFLLDRLRCFSGRYNSAAIVILTQEY